MLLFACQVIFSILPPFLLSSLTSDPHLLQISSWPLQTSALLHVCASALCVNAFKLLEYFSLLKHFPFPKHMSNEFLFFLLLLQFQTFCKFIFYSSVIIVKVYLSGPVFSDNFYLMANFSHTVPCNLHLTQFSQYLQFTEQYLTHLFFWKEVHAIPLHFTA
jgi:hypothetical protein